MNGFKISEHFAQRLKSTVLKVDRIPEASATGVIPTRFEESLRRGGGVLRLCKTSSAFNKNTVATLNVWEDGTPPNETQTFGETVEDVVNKYADIGSGKFVSVAKHGNGRWYVVAADC